MTENNSNNIEPHTHSTDSSIRYAGYLRALARLAKLQRYLAFTSDIGEAFRPVVHPRVV